MWRCAPSSQRRLKNDTYRQISTLREYLLVSQKEPRIEQFVRGEDGEWRLREAAGLGARLELPSVKITIALSEVFANVKFEASRLRVAAPGKK